MLLPTDPRVAQAEARRPHTGKTVSSRLVPRQGRVDLGGLQVDTWTYGGDLPGKEIRVKTGDLVRVELANQLPADTTVHWHGIAIRNDMDGVPELTGSHIPAGGSFGYEFTAANPGTYWFHPHSGTQLDRGLYAPLIVEDPAEPADYDHDWTVVLDDWVDGTGRTPDDILAGLKAMSSMHHDMPGMDGMGHGGMGHDMPGMGGMGTGSELLGGEAGDVVYPHYLVNGRIPTDPVVFTAKPGQRARLRIVNAASDTAFRVALPGHRLRVTHTDGYPVQPAEADALLVGMGERYDVVVALGDGVFPLVALPEGKEGSAVALVRTAAGSPPPPDTRFAEIGGAGPGRLQPADSVRLPDKAPDATVQLDLTGSMMRYDWGINGKPYNLSRRELAAPGQRVRIVFRNRTTMWHPMHLHGHTFQIQGGPRKDTVIVLPGKEAVCDFDADNPGQWMAHCHNTNHQEAGMAAILGYRA